MGREKEPKTLSSTCQKKPKMAQYMYAIVVEEPFLKEVYIVALTALTLEIKAQSRILPERDDNFVEICQRGSEKLESSI